jgi:hypothetical protein
MITIISHNKAHEAQKSTTCHIRGCAFCAFLRQQICIKTRAGIVIALKRNGAYADNIQVLATWIQTSCLKVVNRYG